MYTGNVTEKEEAEETYKKAVTKGESAGHITLM